MLYCVPIVAWQGNILNQGMLCAFFSLICCSTLLGVIGVLSITFTNGAD